MSDRDTPEDIENRIQQTQDELRKDLNALDEKLSPENLKAEARGHVEEAKELVDAKAVEGTRQAGEAVRDRIDDVIDRVLDDEARKPSLSLLGLAAVIGLGLLLVRVQRVQARDDRESDRLQPPPYAPRDMPPRTPASRPY